MTTPAVDRKLLPRTFGPWFGRFEALTEVQRLAIPPLVAGRDVLICSPTASGKTEAYGAPAAEIAAAHAGDSAAVVIVSPTRALANDLRRRLEGPIGLVHLTLGRYTGEHKERIAGRLPNVVITTPEALDSLLARRPEVLAATRMVVLDEIHVLDNTPRGDQLRLLLHRLDSAARTPPQRAAASATVDRPEELAARYLRDPCVVAVPGVRKILGRAFDGVEFDHMARHLDELARAGFRKVLVFCRKREQVETYASKLMRRTLYEEHVFPHHGSLAQSVRERTERLFHAAQSAVCFATLTLEMGIDIGTVDYVLLAGVPADVASVLQRIGRGGRRGDVTRAGFAVENAAQHHVLTTMFRLGKEGRLCGGPYAFRAGVLVQQALVLACAGAWLEVRQLEAVLPPDVRREIGADAAAGIVDAMVEAELLEPAGNGRFVPSEAVERRYTRGTLHSNIAEEPSIEVVDRITGDVIGSVGVSENRHLALGGGERVVVKEGDGRILTDRSRNARAARYRSTGSPSVSLALGRAVVEALGVAPGAIDLVPLEGRSVLVHGLGTAGSLLLLDALGRTFGASAIESASPYAVTLATDPVDLPRPGESDVERLTSSRLKGLEKLTTLGPFGKLVPRSERERFVRRLLGLDEVAAYLAAARLERRTVPDPALRAVLADL